MKRNQCKLLNQIRRRIAEANDIDFVVYECREETCPENCPKSASELEYLESELEKIQLEGKAISLKGVLALDFEPDTPKKSPKNLDKLGELLDNPLISNLPPRYLDSLLD